MGMISVGATFDSGHSEFRRLEPLFFRHVPERSVVKFVEIWSSLHSVTLNKMKFIFLLFKFFFQTHLHYVIKIYNFFRRDLVIEFSQFSYGITDFFSGSTYANWNRIGRIIIEHHEAQKQNAQIGYARYSSV